MTQSKNRSNVPPEIAIVRRFSAPRELVFRTWIEPQHVQAWFAPDGYTCTRCDFDPKPGGSWRVDYRSAEGTSYTERGVFQRVEAPEHLVFTLSQSREGAGQGRETTVTVTFTQVGPETLMTFVQTGFEDRVLRDGNAEGWAECFSKLDRRLAELNAGERSSELQEANAIRRLYARWWDASSAKDIEGAMEPISRSILAYEHQSPLQHVGIDDLRVVCQGGFDEAPGELRWDVPDLQVIVRGDIAVTWGLDRIRQGSATAPSNVTFSRGTRIFQKIDGAWRLIHQHVSFPIDQEGKAVFDLKP